MLPGHCSNLIWITGHLICNCHSGRSSALSSWTQLQIFKNDNRNITAATKNSDPRTSSFGSYWGQSRGQRPFDRTQTHQRVCKRMFHVYLPLAGSALDDVLAVGSGYPSFVFWLGVLYPNQDLQLPLAACACSSCFLFVLWQSESETEGLLVRHSEGC